MIRAILGFSRRSNGYVRLRGYAVLNGMEANPNFPKPPVPLSDLKTSLENLDAAMAHALDGSKQALAERQKCREIVIDMLQQLGHHVESVSKDNMDVFLSSRFEPVRTPGAAE